MSDQKFHEMVSRIRELALELGRTPRKQEILDLGYTQHGIGKMGGVAVLAKAAGLDAPINAKKIDNSIFEKDLRIHLDRFSQESDVLDPKKYYSNNWCVISDIHWPFHHAAKMELFFERAEKKKYDFWVINGDARDMYSHASFPRSHNIFTPREENSVSRKLNEEFWDRAKKINPNAKFVQTTGNHSVRPLKRILEEYPSAEDWIMEALKKEFTFEGVDTIFNPRDFILLNDEIAIFHGYKSKLGEHRDQHLMSCIVGHTHRPGIVYRRMMNKIIFEANSGFMGNPQAKGLTYTNSKMNEWVNGFLEGDEKGPRFIPL